MWGASECGDTGDPCPGLRVSWMSSFSPALLLPLPLILLASNNNRYKRQCPGQRAEKVKDYGC